MRHLTRLPQLTLLAGSVTAVVGGMVIAESWQAVSLLLSTATAVALVALASIRRLPTDMVEQRLLAIVGRDRDGVERPRTDRLLRRASGTRDRARGVGHRCPLVAVGGRSWLRLPILSTVFGAIALVGGAALDGIELERVGPLFGIGTALALHAVGVSLDRFALSVIGSIGLLIDVPWAILEWFPGEGRAPLLIMVSGALIIAIAAVLTRTGGGFPHIGGRHGTPPHPVT